MILVLTILAGILALLPQEAPQDSRPAATVVDHAAFDRILAAVVRDERVDYVAVRKTHSKELTKYLGAMSRIDHLRLPRDERYAYYVNLYNAVVLRTVADRLRPGYSVADDGYGLFKEKIVRLKDRTVSLDHLEKTMMWNDFRDPRMHVAVVCGAVSCPPLLPRAYRGADLEAVLDRNMKKFVNDPGRNRFDLQGRRMKLSRLFDWYARDFGGKQNVAAYIDRYHPARVEGFAVGFLDYDWTLNAVRGPQERGD